jgi:hypothetical protein
MNGSIIQMAVWLAAGGAMLLFLKRRRARRVRL